MAPSAAFSCLIYLHRAPLQKTQSYLSSQALSSTAQVKRNELEKLLVADHRTPRDGSAATLMRRSWG